MADFIVIGILIITIGAAVTYIVKEKKKGTKCIGCPSGGSCSSKNNGCSGGCSSCHSNAKEKK